jgi:hypothetical protein
MISFHPRLFRKTPVDKRARSGKGLSRSVGGTPRIARRPYGPITSSSLRAALERLSAPSHGPLMPTHVAEGDETLLILVPQHQSHASEALQQGEPADAVEVWMVAQHDG